MQIFSQNGDFLARIGIHFIDIVAGLAITPDGNIVIVDSVTAYIYVIAENGQTLKRLHCGDMQEPSDIAVFNNCFYVCDFKGHSVTVYDSEGKFIKRIGDPKITNYPNGIDIASNGDICIGKFLLFYFYSQRNL